jgi:hypothetical protein
VLLIINNTFTFLNIIILEISRKIYSKIIWILKDKNISSDNSIELADSICQLLEWENVSGYVSTQNELSLPTAQIMTQKTANIEIPKLWEKRKLIPWTKYPWWYVNDDWIFIAVQPWKWLDWIRDENGNLDTTLTYR